MARIKWLQHPTDKTLNGTIEHVAREFAVVAVGYKQAQYEPFKTRIEAMDDYERRRVGIPPGSTPVTNVVGIQHSIGVTVAGSPCIFRRQATETQIILDLETARVCGVPKNVAEKFKAVLDAADPAKAGEALHAAKMQQQEQNLRYGK
jgi:hypothetical protein